MVTKLKIPAEDTSYIAIKRLENQNEQHKRDLGILGRFFGSGSNAPIYIIGVLTFTLVITGLIYIFIPDSSKSISTWQFWSIILPVITTLTGYLFGVNAKK